MKKGLVFIIVILLNINNIYSQNEAKLTVIRQEQGSYILVAQHQFHLNYGLAFPLTFQFSLPTGITGLVAKEKYSSGDSWEVISEKRKDDIFNDEKAVRFDYEEGYAFVSSAFGTGDSLFIQICDSVGNNINAVYRGITKYYDNRKAAVTVSADDWYDEYNSLFKSLLNFFRSYGLYVTVGVTTNGVTQLSWDEIQSQLDKGFVEVASHSRTHPLTPYSDVYGEVKGSLDDILKNLNMPKYYNTNNKEYVYVWIAPSGDYDSIVDSLVTVSNYLVPRLYLNLPIKALRDFTNGDSHLSKWDASANHYEPFYPTVELGAPYWGGGDTSLTSLNNLFDSVVARGEVYHPMWHPQELIRDINKSYLKNHLGYISRRPNLWYVNLGPLYLYHMIYEANSKSSSYVKLSTIKHLPEPLEIVQNSFNHSNSYSTIRFELPKNTFVNIAIYSTIGEKVLTLANQNMVKGIYEVNLDAGKLESGTYSCLLTVGDKVFIKKIML